jgi:hypothetical protein
MEEGAAAPSEAPGEGVGLALKSPRVRPAEGGRWFLPLVFIPLVLYAILATAAAALLYHKYQQKPPSLFEQAPDLEGDNPGARKASTGAVIRYKRPDKPFKITTGTVTRPLPEHLIVKLGEKLNVGDLEVQPLQVYRKRVTMYDEGAKDVEGKDRPEDCQHDSLVLELRLRNVSDDNIFTPLDNYFDRRWKQGEGAPPFTLIEAGDQVFFGGPARWLPRSGRAPDARRQWIEGRKNFDPEGLKPGAGSITKVASNGEDEEVANFFFGGKNVRPYAGPLLWRVHLRRGLVSWRGRQVPATAVIGVRFTDRDYRRGG